MALFVRILRPIFVVLLVLAAESAFAEEGTIIRKSFSGPVTQAEVRYVVYLPPDYETSGKRYSVLYSLHPLSQDETWGNESTAAALEAAVRKGIVPPMSIVFPNAYRNSFYADSKRGHKPTETNIIRELIPHIDTTYRTLTSRRNRAVMGFSMGGYGALALALKFPEFFCSAVSFDGALLTWQMLATNKPDIARDVSEMDSTYFQAYSIYKHATQNAPEIGSRVGVCLVTGALKESNHRFRDHLRALNRPFEYKETTCGHHQACLYKQEAKNSFRFLAKWGFDKPK